MKHYLHLRFYGVIAAVMFTALSLRAQTPGFAVTVGGAGFDEGYTIVQTHDGGYAIAGLTYSFGDTVGNDDTLSGNVYVIKLDASGNLKWTKTIGGDSSDVGYSMVQTNDDGFAITGYSTSYGAGNNDVYVIKLDSAGNLKWTKTIGGEGNDVGYSIIQSKDHGYAIAGYSQSFGNTTAGGVYIIKLDSDGNLKWTKTIGSTLSCIGNSIIQTTDGGYAIAGYSFSLATGSQHMYLIKLDSTGALTKAVTIGGLGTDIATSLVQSRDGGYTIAGYTSSYGAGIDNVYIVKLGVTGNLKWSRTIGGTGVDKGNSIIQAANGDYVVTGTTTSFGLGNTNVYTMELDSSGNLLWTKAIGQAGDNESTSIIQTNDGSFATAGFTNNYGAGDYDVFVLKLDTAGDLCYTQPTGGTITSSDSGTIISSGNVTSADSGRVSQGGALNSGGMDSSVCNLLNSVNVVLPVAAGVQLFPNPGSGMVTVTITGIYRQTTIEIYNSFGEKVYSSYLNNNTCQLDLQKQTQGLYLYRVLNENGSTVAEGKLVIAR